MNTDPSGLCIPPATIVCVIVLAPTISAGAIIVWTAAAAGVGVLVYAATHDNVFRPDPPTSLAKHEKIPAGQVDEHQIKEEYSVPKGHDLYRDPDTKDVYAHRKGERGEAVGEGELLDPWDYLKETYPKQKGPQ
jgi:hypothetical protein